LAKRHTLRAQVWHRLESAGTNILYACSRAHIIVHALTHMHMYSLTHSHQYTHTYTSTHAHAPTHSHTRPRTPLPHTQSRTRCHTNAHTRVPAHAAIQTPAHTAIQMPTCNTRRHRHIHAYHCTRRYHRRLIDQHSAILWRLQRVFWLHVLPIPRFPAYPGANRLHARACRSARQNPPYIGKSSGTQREGILGS